MTPRGISIKKAIRFANQRNNPTNATSLRRKVKKKMTEK
jgi:hypothetical protein